MISTFVFKFVDSITLNMKFKVTTLFAPAAVQAFLYLTWPETQKMGFHVHRNQNDDSILRRCIIRGVNVNNVSISARKAILGVCDKVKLNSPCAVSTETS